MDNQAIAKTLLNLAQLKELDGKDAFRISSVLGASRKVEKMPMDISAFSFDELIALDGIGKGVAKSIVELREKGSIAELEQLRRIIPRGVIDMLQIPGLGPKKIRSIWKELAIETISDLEYACNENRLIRAKGFGLKSQSEILLALDFLAQSSGYFLYSYLEKLASPLLLQINGIPWVLECSVTGDLRRRVNFSDKIEILVAVENDWKSDLTLLYPIFTAIGAPPTPFHFTPLPPGGPLMGKATTTLSGEIPLNLFFCSPSHWPMSLFMTTGSANFLEKLPKINSLAFPSTAFAQEEDIFTHLSSPFLEPEMREDWAKLAEVAGIDPKSFTPQKKPSHSLIETGDLHGALHNHSTYSDGIHRLEEMVVESIRLGFEYFGISDHSKTAVYAGGLTQDKILLQHQEIDRLNIQYAPFKIFKGIESDILPSGQLDYPDEILGSFDFIVASIHSNLNMDRDKATERLLTAISNPYTTILGHLTGRLLLGRRGYELDMPAVIKACIDHAVVIELNANPKRLDIDWKWIGYALNEGAMLSINPDAHRKESLSDMRFGVQSARKGGLTADRCLNALPLEPIEAYLRAQRRKRS